MGKTLEKTIKDMLAAQPSASKNWRSGTTMKQWKTCSNKQGGAKYLGTNEYRSKKGTRNYRREYASRAAL
nr:unnamed protein product [Callosobruchus analis]